MESKAIPGNRQSLQYMNYIDNTLIKMTNNLLNIKQHLNIHMFLIFLSRLQSVVWYFKVWHAHIIRASYGRKRKTLRHNVTILNNIFNKTCWSQEGHILWAGLGTGTHIAWPPAASTAHSTFISLGLEHNYEMISLCLNNSAHLQIQLNVVFPLWRELEFSGWLIENKRSTVKDQQ